MVSRTTFSRRDGLLRAIVSESDGLQPEKDKRIPNAIPIDGLRFGETEGINKAKLLAIGRDLSRLGGVCT